MYLIQLCLLEGKKRCLRSVDVNNASQCAGFLFRGLLTHWMSPSLAQPRAMAHSPSGWASRAIAAGATKNGAVLGQPSIDRRVLASVMFRITRGLSIILL